MSMKWEIAQSICNKIISKNIFDILKTKLSKTPEQYSLRMCITRTTTTWPWCRAEHGVQVTEGNTFKIVSSIQTTAFSTRPAASIKYLNFSSEIERYNAWQSYLTKFARFCVMLDESTKLAPYMDDYTEPWTDKRFKEHFELTDIEWQLIDKVISGKIK